MRRSRDILLSIIKESVKLKNVTKFDKKMFRVNQLLIAVVVSSIVLNIVNRNYSSLLFNSVLLSNIFVYYLINFDYSITKKWYEREVRKFSETLIDLRERGIQVKCDRDDD